MGKVIDLTGQVFGRLTVVGFAGIGSNRSARWECICLCGAVVVINSATLRNGRTQSCGCYHKQLLRERNTLHGLCKSTEYGSWSNMRKRCNRPNDPQYADYGGRGITVCEEWESFENFYKDMGPKPTPKHSIDRIDVNSNYEPSNCRWADRIVQARNMRRSTADDSGVRYNERDNCWELFIRADNKTVRVGSYINKEDAVAARKAAVQKYWVHGDPAPSAGALQRNNTSGHRGISWSKEFSKWECYVYANRKRKLIGRFTDLEDAVQARAHHGITAQVKKEKP